MLKRWKKHGDTHLVVCQILSGIVLSGHVDAFGSPANCVSGLGENVKPRVPFSVAPPGSAGASLLLKGEPLVLCLSFVFEMSFRKCRRYSNASSLSYGQVLFL